MTDDSQPPKPTADIAHRPSAKRVEVAVPPATSELASTLAFSVNKGGSTLLFNLLTDACAHLGVTWFSPEDVFFSQGHVARNRPQVTDIDFAPTGYCFGGFRNFPHYRIPLLDTARAIWLVRDPRDVMVSLYYSMAFSHEAPGGEAGERFRASRGRVQEMGVDAFARHRVIQQVRTIEGYYAQSFTTRPNVRCYRYEDVIFEKRAWLGDIAEWFDWDLTDAVIDAIVTPHDVVPETADPTRHIRRVRPGAYREELSAPVVRRLETLFAEFMRDFDYLP